MRLKDKVAFVTGAASGIGKEIAIVYVRSKIASADLNAATAEASVAELEKSGARFIGISLDMT